MKTCGLLTIVLAVGAQAQPPAETSFQSMLQRGRELQASGRYQQSLVHFESALRLAEVADASWESTALARLSHLAGIFGVRARKFLLLATAAPRKSAKTA